MKRRTLVADRYGKAFFQVAKDQKVLESVEADFKQLANLLDVDPTLVQALKNPLIEADQLRAFFVDLSKQLKLKDLTARFLHVLTENSRTSFLGETIGVYKKLLLNERNQLIVEINSNAPMSEQAQGKIRDVLSKRTGKDIILNFAIKEDLLGGIVIHYDSYTLDFSLKSKLAELKHELERLG